MERPFSFFWSVFSLLFSSFWAGMWQTGYIEKKRERVEREGWRGLYLHPQEEEEEEEEEAEAAAEGGRGKKCSVAS